MTPTPERRRTLLTNARRAVEGFRIRAGLASHRAYDCLTVSYIPYDDGGQTFHFLTLNDSGPPSSDLAGLRVQLTEARGAGSQVAYTNERGEASLNGLQHGAEYTVEVGEQLPEAESRRVVFREPVREDLGLALSASAAEEVSQEFLQSGAVRRAVLRKDEGGDVTVSVAVTLPHPHWGNARLALVRVEPATSTAVEWVVGLAQSIEDAGEGYGSLTLGRLAPELLARGCRFSVTPVSVADLSAGRDRGAVVALLRRSCEATEHDDCRESLEAALRALGEPMTQVASAAKAEPELPKPAPVESPAAPEVAPTPAAAEDTQVLPKLAGLAEQMAQLRSMFQKKIAQDEQSKQMITTLHARLKAAEEDLVLKILKPVLLKMLDWYDTLARHAPANPVAEDLLKDLEATLYTLGVEKFESAEERFNPKEQKVKPVENDDPARTGVIVERLRPGFRYQGGLILRPEHVSAYKAPAGR